MATKRKAIRDAVVAKLQAVKAAHGVDFISTGARHPARVANWPSMDVLTGRETRAQRPSDMADRTLRIIVRLFHRPGADAELDDLAEMVESAVRADPTLGGLVVEIRAGDEAGVALENDEGWAAMQGFGPVSEVRFLAKWEAYEP